MEPSELSIKRLVQLRIATRLRVASENLWADRGGLHFLDLQDAHAFADLVAQIDRFAEVLEIKSDSG